MGPSVKFVLTIIDTTVIRSEHIVFKKFQSKYKYTNTACDEVPEILVMVKYIF